MGGMDIFWSNTMFTSTISQKAKKPNKITFNIYILIYKVLIANCLKEAVGCYAT